MYPLNPRLHLSRKYAHDYTLAKSLFPPGPTGNPPQVWRPMLSRFTYIRHTAQQVGTDGVKGVFYVHEIE
jgi:hypothetical protein